MPRSIELSRGLVALVDDADFDHVSQYRWYARPVQSSTDTFYAYRSQDVRPKTIYLHRFIMNAPSGVLVDHRDGNGLNCQRSNLRLATHSQNVTNRHTSPKTGYRGVEFRPRHSVKRFVARIWLDGRGIQLGSFETPEEAARAYDKAALERHGQFARLNFPRAAP